MPAGRADTRPQSGMALVTCLALLAAVMILGSAAADMATQGERGARMDRDRHLAFQSAEAALRDAEREIEGNDSLSAGRKAMFARPDQSGFIAGCGAGDANPAQGLCLASARDPAWVSVDLADRQPGSSRSVAYGRFTGQRLTTGVSSLPARLPRYIIEALPFRFAGAAADSGRMSWSFRITAIGFGANAATRVVLQTVYRPEPG